MGKPLTNTKQVEVKSRDELRQWLQNNYTQKPGVWLVRYKKSSKY
ncbi:MAG: hypothetical protein AAGE96_19995 [Cyanobacteria bacterium P01_G01_bin.19]